MNLHLGYSIMKPLQLPWMYVSPSGSRGLDYHLSPDLFIRMEGIIAGNMEFVVSHVVLGLEGIEVDAIQAEHIFKSEFLPAKSKERVMKAFKDEQSSCFFQTRHMEWLQKHFDENNFISTDVTVYYKDKKIEDVASLPAKEFKLAYHALDDLGAVQIMPLKENREELTQKYEERYQEKVAELEEKTKKSLWEKVKAKSLRKKIGFAFGSVAVGIAAIIAQRVLVERGGATSLIAAFLIGTVGVFVELYGRNEANGLLRQLQYEGKERMAF